MGHINVDIKTEIPLGNVKSIKLNYTKGGRSANKFFKSQIRKFAGFKFILYLETFRKGGNFRICDLRDPVFFATCRFTICGHNYFLRT